MTTWRSRPSSPAIIAGPFASSRRRTPLASARGRRASTTPAASGIRSTGTGLNCSTPASPAALRCQQLVRRSLMRVNSSKTVPSNSWQSAGDSDLSKATSTCTENRQQRYATHAGVQWKRRTSAKGTFQPGDHRIDSARKPADLIVRIQHRQSPAEVFSGDRRRLREAFRSRGARDTGPTILTSGTGARLPATP